MDQWIELRDKMYNQDVPLRQLERETGIGRQTLRKIRDNSQPPGEAQVDFGQALANFDGTLKKVIFFVMSMVHSDAMFVMAFPRECTESFLEAHVRAFDFFGFVPKRISYDNTRVAVTKIFSHHKRKHTAEFKRIISHYLFEPHFCNVRRPNEKGIVEGSVKYARLNFMVPVPQVKDYDELNELLRNCCKSDLDRILRGKCSQTKNQLLAEDKVAAIACRMTSLIIANQRQRSLAANLLFVMTLMTIQYLLAGLIIR